MDECWRNLGRARIALEEQGDPCMLLKHLQIHDILPRHTQKLIEKKTEQKGNPAGMEELLNALEARGEAAYLALRNACDEAKQPNLLQLLPLPSRTTLQNSNKTADNVSLPNQTSPTTQVIVHGNVNNLQVGSENQQTRQNANTADYDDQETTPTSQLEVMERANSITVPSVDTENTASVTVGTFESGCKPAVVTCEGKVNGNQDSKSVYQCDAVYHLQREREKELKVSTSQKCKDREEKDEQQEQQAEAKTMYKPTSQAEVTDKHKPPQAEARNMDKLIAPQAEARNMDKLTAPQAEARNMDKLIAPQAEASNMDKLTAPQAEASNMDKLIAPQAEARNMDKLIAPQVEAKDMDKHMPQQTRARHLPAQAEVELNLDNVNKGVQNKTMDIPLDEIKDGVTTERKNFFSLENEPADTSEGYDSDEDNETERKKLLSHPEECTRSPDQSPNDLDEMASVHEVSILQRNIEESREVNESDLVNDGADSDHSLFSHSNDTVVTNPNSTIPHTAPPSSDPVLQGNGSLVNEPEPQLQQNEGFRLVALVRGAVLNSIKGNQFSI